MNDESPAEFGYRLRELGGEWRWIAFDLAGKMAAEGRAPTRAAAAACVIRALARGALEDRALVDRAGQDQASDEGADRAA